MDPRAATLGHLGERRDLVGAVGRAELGDLCEAHGNRLAVMDGARRKTGEAVGQNVRRELAARARKADQSDPGTQEFRGSGLVHDDVRLLVAEDDAAGAGKRRQTKGIGGGARADEEDGDLALEEVAEALLDFFRK